MPDQIQFGFIDTSKSLKSEVSKRREDLIKVIDDFEKEEMGKLDKLERLDHDIEKTNH